MHTHQIRGLHWRRNKDGSCDYLDDNTKVGHIVQIEPGFLQQGEWQWFVGFVYREDGNRYRSSCKEAMLAVERAVQWQHATYPNARDMAPYPVKR